MSVPRRELRQRLNEQLVFMALSSAAYDAGFRPEFVRLALSIRVLVYDTKNSVSLLSLLGEKKRIRYLDTAWYPPDQRAGTCAVLTTGQPRLVMVQVGGQPMFRPILDEDSSDPQRPRDLVPFDDWWSAGVIFPPKTDEEFSRRDLVLWAANKSGGAHVDDTLPEDYDRLSNLNAIAVSPSENPVPATIRQIAHELAASITSQIKGASQESPRQTTASASVDIASAHVEVKYSTNNE